MLNSRENVQGRTGSDSCGGGLRLWKYKSGRKELRPIVGHHLKPVTHNRRLIFKFFYPSARWEGVRVR
jgi:hypothetical protein